MRSADDHGWIQSLSVALPAFVDQTLGLERGGTVTHVPGLKCHLSASCNTGRQEVAKLVAQAFLPGILARCVEIHLDTCDKAKRRHECPRHAILREHTVRNAG